MSLATIRTRVSNNVNRDDITTSQYNTFINDAQRMICRAHNFDWMIREVTASTVDSQRTYSVPSSALRFKSEISLDLINNDGYRVPMIRKHKRDIEAMLRHQKNLDKGVPKYYAIENDTIYLYDLPDHTLNGGNAWTINMEYYGYLDNFTTDADTNDLETQYPELLEYFATSIALDVVEEYEQARLWKAKAGEVMSALITEENIRRFSSIETGIEPERGAGTYPKRYPYGIDLTAHYD